MTDEIEKELVTLADVTGSFGPWQGLVNRWLKGWEPEQDEYNKCNWHTQTHASGQRFTLTAEKASKLLLTLEAGSFQSVALRFADVSPALFMQWMRNGGSMRYKGAKERSEAIEPYRTFSMMADVVEGLPEIMALSSVQASGDWRAQAWFLERRYRQRWGNDKAQVGVNVGAGGIAGGGSAVVIMIPDNGRDGLLDRQGDVALPHTMREIDAGEGVDEGGRYDHEE